MTEYLISVQAPEPDEEGNLDGDVLVVTANSPASAQKKAEVPSGWIVTNVTKHVAPEDDEVLPEDYEVQR